jgi:RNA polymerase sigma-70 factor (ECF subfamily)
MVSAAAGTFALLWRGSVPASWDLDAALRRAYDAARAVFPSLSVSPEEYAGFLAGRIAVDADPIAAIGAVRAADLYLACACAAGNAAALKEFDDNFLAAAVDLWPMPLSPAAIDATKRALRHELLVEGPAGTPKLYEYTGRDDLRSWLRSNALRVAIRVGRRPAGASDHPPRDLETDALTKRYRREFQEAFDEALGALPRRSRSLLRLRFTQPLTAGEIGALYGVDGATAARWVAAARDEMAMRTRVGVMRRVRVPYADMARILRLIPSQVETSLRRAEW